MDSYLPFEEPEYTAEDFPIEEDSAGVFISADELLALKQWAEDRSLLCRRATAAEEEVERLRQQLASSEATLCAVLEKAKAEEALEKAEDERTLTGGVTKASDKDVSDNENSQTHNMPEPPNDASAKPNLAEEIAEHRLRDCRTLEELRTALQGLGLPLGTRKRLELQFRATLAGYPLCLTFIGGAEDDRWTASAASQPMSSPQTKKRTPLGVRVRRRLGEGAVAQPGAQPALGTHHSAR